METLRSSLILSFYKNLLQDFVVLFPEDSLEYEFNFIEERSKDLLSLVKLFSKLGKNIESSLISLQKLEVPDGIPVADGSQLPRFLYAQFCTLFHEDGVPLYALEGLSDLDREVAKHSAICVLTLRQFFLAFSKAEDIDCERSEEEEVGDFLNRVTTIPKITCNNVVLSVARHLLEEVLGDGQGGLCAELAQWESNPFGVHGPGAVAAGEKGKDKYDFSVPIGFDIQLFVPELLNPKAYLPCEEEHRNDVVSRLAVVPKDFRGHRLICIEPKEAMWAQQGLMRVLYERVSSHPLTRRSISFKSQEKSFFLSKSYRFSTIDLKDASDRVSKTLCRLLFNKKVYRLLTRYRSRQIEAYSGYRTTYETMFTMGNALCFPIETLVFWAISVAAMYVQRCVMQGYDPARMYFTFRYPYSPEGEMDYQIVSYQFGKRNTPFASVYSRVFGDDIIVPRIYYECVTGALESCGFVVNRSKSCDNTLVRESCGSWWYHEYDCRIVRFGSHKLQNTRAWIGFLENSRALAQCGFYSAAQSVLDFMAVMHAVPPYVAGLPGLRVWDDCYRWNKDLQRVEVWLPMLENVDRRQYLPGNWGIYSFFAGSATSAFVQSDTSCVKWTWARL